MNGCVLDTSVIVKWFSGEDEPDLDAALRLRDEIVSGTCAVKVPGLLFYELANALRYNPNFSCTDVNEAVQAVIRMEFSVHGADLQTLNRAVEIAFGSNVTVYDATFLALAEAEGVPFVTADYKFCDRVPMHEGVARLDRLY